MSALIVKESRDLDRILKRVRRNKFGNAIKNTSEIKASASSPELRKYLIERMNVLNNIRAVHCVIDKSKNKKKIDTLKKDDFYNSVAEVLAEGITIKSSVVELHIDKSKGKQILRDRFNAIFEKKLRTGSNINTVRIYHSYSEKFSGLQLVDLLAWVVYQKYNNNDETYFDLIDAANFRQKIITI